VIFVRIYHIAASTISSQEGAEQFIILIFCLKASKANALTEVNHYSTQFP
jgi:hypothetical protein